MTPIVLRMSGRLWRARLRVLSSREIIQGRELPGRREELHAEHPGERTWTPRFTGFGDVVRKSWPAARPDIRHFVPCLGFRGYRSCPALRPGRFAPARSGV